MPKPNIGSISLKFVTIHIFANLKYLGSFLEVVFFTHQFCREGETNDSLLLQEANSNGGSGSDSVEN